MYAPSMAVEAWRGKLWEPGTHAPQGQRIRVRRGALEGRFGFGRWAAAIGLAALAILSAAGGYGAAAESNREGLFVVAFAAGLVVGGRLWFR